jgi:arabinogalactan endo-1,4-beta-galactosidase
LLSFHYSDSWADPGKQTKPAAWTNLTFLQLEQQMYDYSSNAIAAFKAANAMPDYIQVGNEIIGGLLWPDGRVGGSYDTPAQWAQFGRLVKAAIRGIKDAAGTNQPKIMIHIDRGGDWGATQWFFDSLLQQQVEFDLIGQSYYPWWHGNLDALRNCLTNAAIRYGKPVLVAETAFPWTNSPYNPNLGIPSSTDGQVQFVSALAEILKRVPGGKGAGICWWGAEYVPVAGFNLASFHRTSFFDFEGNALPVVQAFGQLTAPIRLSASLFGTNVTLQWPLSGAGMLLKTATNTSPPVFWMPVTNAVQSTGAGFNVMVPAVPGAGRFYQLQLN